MGHKAASRCSELTWNAHYSSTHHQCWYSLYLPTKGWRAESTPYQVESGAGIETGTGTCRMTVRCSTNWAISAGWQQCWWPWWCRMMIMPQPKPVKRNKEIPSRRSTFPALIFASREIFIYSKKFNFYLPYSCYICANNKYVPQMPQMCHMCKLLKVPSLAIFARYIYHIRSHCN